MTAADDRALRAELRSRDQVYAAAFGEGLRGVPLDPEAWPDDPAVVDAWDAGMLERRRRRSDRRRAVVVRAGRWCGRRLMPTTARRFRRLARRWRRVRRTIEAMRS